MTLARSYEPFGTTLASSGTGQTVWQYVGEARDPSGLTFMRARYYQSGTGRFTTRDVWPPTLNGWLYTEANPINRVDPSGHNWQSPTPVEGTAIHKMIDQDFYRWGYMSGRLVAFEEKVKAASKQRSSIIVTADGIIERPIPDIDDGPDEYGKADLVEFASPSFVYEIKTIRSAKVAVADAKWYQYHLNIDEDLLAYGPWYLGTSYLAEFRGRGKFIGPWPGDPNHVVLAELWANGAIVYWGKQADRVREPNFENAEDYARYVAWLATLAAAAAAAGNELGKRKQPVYPMTLVDFLDYLCRPATLQWETDPGSLSLWP